MFHRSSIPNSDLRLKQTEWTKVWAGGTYKVKRAPNITDQEPQNNQDLKEKWKLYSISGYNKTNPLFIKYQRLADELKQAESLGVKLMIDFCIAKYRMWHAQSGGYKSYCHDDAPSGLWLYKWIFTDTSNLWTRSNKVLCHPREAIKYCFERQEEYLSIWAEYYRLLPLHIESWDNMNRLNKEFLIARDEFTASFTDEVGHVTTSILDMVLHHDQSMAT